MSCLPRIIAKVKSKSGQEGSDIQKQKPAFFDCSNLFKSRGNILVEDKKKFIDYS